MCQYNRLLYAPSGKWHFEELGHRHFKNRSTRIGQTPFSNYLSHGQRERAALA
jgi:hypothetical protein